jgi:hypothetical protein
MVARFQSGLSRDQDSSPVGGGLGVFFWYKWCRRYGGYDDEMREGCGEEDGGWWLVGVEEKT